MKRTAVVFGATGLTGKELVDQLLHHPEYEKITIVVRRQLRDQSPQLIQIIIKDFSNLQQYESQLKANDYFCCIGTTIKTAGSQEAFRAVDLGIPEKIAMLAQSLNVDSMVVISSIGADAHSTNFYLRTKGEMEQTVRGIYTGNLKFVRPSLLMGKRDEHRFGEGFALAAMSAIGWSFIGPLKKYKGIHVSKVAGAMIKAARLPADKVYINPNELIYL